MDKLTVAQFEIMLDAPMYISLINWFTSSMFGCVKRCSRATFVNISPIKFSLYATFSHSFGSTTVIFQLMWHLLVTINNQTKKTSKSRYNLQHYPSQWLLNISNFCYLSLFLSFIWLKKKLSYWLSWSRTDLDSVAEDKRISEEKTEE